jgi:hypothetical protein
MAVICDLNNTILDDSLKPITKTVKYLQSLREPIYIVSGADPKDRDMLVAILRRNEVPYTRLLLNPSGSDNDFKYRTAIRLKPIRLAIDNNEKARARYEEAGIKTIHPRNLPDMDKFWNLP